MKWTVGLHACVVCGFKRNFRRVKCHLIITLQNKSNFKGKKGETDSYFTYSTSVLSICRVNNFPITIQINYTYISYIMVCK